MELDADLKELIKPLSDTDINSINSLKAFSNEFYGLANHTRNKEILYYYKNGLKDLKRIKGKKALNSIAIIDILRNSVKYVNDKWERLENMGELYKQENKPDKEIESLEGKLPIGFEERHKEQLCLIR